jgi:hypothetical protein
MGRVLLTFQRVRRSDLLVGTGSLRIAPLTQNAHSARALSRPAHVQPRLYVVCQRPLIRG